jgi:hypothetical protein
MADLDYSIFRTDAWIARLYDYADNLIGCLSNDLTLSTALASLCLLACVVR